MSADTREMDRALMTAWTSVVGPDDTVLNGGDVAPAGSLGERGRARIRAVPGRKVLVVGNHYFGRRTGVLEPTGHEVASGILAVDTDPPLVLTHVPMGLIPPGWVNLHGHVHNNEPPRTTPHINVCVERTRYKPLPLKRLSAGTAPDGATTADRIRSAKRTEAGRVEGDPNGRDRTESAM